MKLLLLVIGSLIFLFADASAQLSGSSLVGAGLNAIPVSVPFLTIAPDGRSSGIGDAGVASAPDVNAQHWNAAKYAFTYEKGQVTLSYSPWITNLIPDVAHLYLAGYYKLSDRSAISSSVRFFSLGTIAYPGVGVTGAQYQPREFALDAGYSRKFTDHFSGGVVLRYIQSDPSGGAPSPGGSEPVSGRTLASDLGLYYQNDIQLKEKVGQWALGLNISNIGPPVSYTEDIDGTPIPTNLRLGGRFTYGINDNNALSFHIDLNKLMVPSPRVYAEDSLTGNLILIRGKEPRSVIQGMFQSFYDAPGVMRSNGSYSIAGEELREIALCLGLEYWYKKRFALRTGYFHEHASKGNRGHYTFGLGVKYKFLSCDISYLLAQEGQSSPLNNTFRFTMTAEFGTKVF